MKDFFERATTLRDTIEQSEGLLKDIKLDFLCQLVGQVFRYKEIHLHFTIQSDYLQPQVAEYIIFSLLQDLNIKEHIFICYRTCLDLSDNIFCYNE